MYLSLPALAFALALQSLEVATSVVDLPEPVFMLPRNNNGDGNGSSSATTSTSTMSSNNKHQSSTTYTSNTHTISSSTSTTKSDPTSTTTGTLTSSSSSGYASTTSTSSSSSAQNNVYGSTLTASQGLSTAARTGLAFGIFFFLILSAMLVCYLRRRSRTAREKTSDGPAILSSEASQHRPPAPGASPERELLAPPPPWLHPAYMNSSDVSRSPRHSTNLRIAPLLKNDSSRNPHPASAWNRYSTLLRATNIQPTTREDVPTLPNPYDLFSAPAPSASYASSTQHANLHTSVCAATTSTFAAPVNGSSNSREPRSESSLSPLHANLVRHQKQLELEHDKRLEAKEGPQDPPPEYSS